MTAPLSQPIYGSTLPITSLQPLPNHHHSSGCGSIVPRFHKLDFSTCDGLVGPLGCLNRYKQFFRGLRTGKADKVWTAAYHLTDDTQFWYLQLERNFGMLTW